MAKFDERRRWERVLKRREDRANADSARMETVEGDGWSMTTFIVGDPIHNHNKTTASAGMTGKAARKAEKAERLRVREHEANECARLSQSYGEWGEF
jgi:hypothetical protein